MVGYSADDYLRFSADKETIYYSEPVYACEDAYVLPTNDNSEQWGVRSDGHWTYVNCLMYSFPPQGWKIHITSTIYDAQNVLYDVAEYLFVKSISFKYLSSRTCFIQANGKYADRLESGKFITIYPSSEHIFIQLLKDLKTIVCKYDDGPYILTDKQWQNSNVFFRYGALKPRFSNEKNVPVIVTPQGDLIPDKELPLYSLPSFVDEPIYVKENNYFFEFIMITVFFCCSMKLKLICIPEIFQFIHIFPTKYFGDSPYREKKLRTIIFPLIFRCQSTAEQYHMNVRVEVHFRAPCMKDADITNGSSKVLWV